MSKILALSGLLFFTSCATYWAQRDCEKIDWRGRARSLASEGELISSDSGLNHCRGIEAKVSDTDLNEGFRSGVELYCKPETALARGKDGKPLNENFCDSTTMAQMKASYALGIGEFCRPANAFKVGRSGSKYAKQCAQDQEPDFMKEFSKGHKDFLADSIDQTKRKIKTNQSAHEYLERRLSGLQRELSALPTMNYVAPGMLQSDGTIATIGHYEPVGNGQRSQLESQIQNVKNELNENEADHLKLRDSLNDYGREIESYE